MPRCTRHALRRALRRRQRPRSALPRRWRNSALGYKSRQKACYAHAAGACAVTPGLQGTHAPYHGWDCRTCCARARLGHRAVELSWNSASLHCQDAPCFPDFAVLLRCTKRALRGALRRRPQPRSAALQRWRTSARSATSRRAAHFMCRSPLRCASLLLRGRASDRQNIKVRCTTAARPRGLCSAGALLVVHARRLLALPEPSKECVARNANEAAAHATHSEAAACGGEAPSKSERKLVSGRCTLLC